MCTYINIVIFASLDSEKVIFRKETEDCNTPRGMRVHFDVTKDEFVLNSRVR